jgi:hypothetical protein
LEFHIDSMFCLSQNFNFNILLHFFIIFLKWKSSAFLTLSVCKWELIWGFLVTWEGHVMWSLLGYKWEKNVVSLRSPERISGLYLLTFCMVMLISRMEAFLWKVT